VNYACVSTGNFHEGNAMVYSDLFLFTADKRITSEVKRVFDFFENPYKNFSYRHLIKSPLYLRRKMYQLIDQEIKNARAGKKAYIILKLNSLVDKTNCQGNMFSYPRRSRIK
jgi:polyphosphate kinase